jgi:hypothetical protein
MRLVVCAVAGMRLVSESRIVAQTVAIRRMHYPRMGCGFYNGYEARCPRGSSASGAPGRERRLAMRE